MESLLGRWSGEASTISADWPEPDGSPCRITIDRDGNGRFAVHTQSAAGEEASGTGATRLLLLPDGGYCLAPLQVSHREAFTVEAGWLPSPGRLERLIRRYDAGGAWISATWISAKAD